MPQISYRIDPISATVLKVTPLFGTNELGSATAFSITWEGQHYLVTNWHVVAGRNPDTNECLDKNLSIPNKLLVSFHSSASLGIWKIIVIDLLDLEGQPVWIEHPLGSMIDVVVIPLLELNDIKIYPLDLSLADFDMVPMPAMPISIIGYPLGLTAGESWPIWKTGHIASDPDIDFQPGRPAFLIDATTRSGMSGSPAILRQDSYMKKSGDQILASGLATKFMGIYSGRIHKDSEIGRVWRPFVLKEILSGRLIFDQESRRPLPRRIDKCPCHSSKRFKHCCGKLYSQF